MTDEKQSFTELLKEAPLAAETDTIIALGALARTHEPDKFVLVMANGSVTLETSAVKSFRRLGGVVGQILVELELDAKKLSRELEIRRGDGSTLGAGGPTIAVIDLHSGGPEKSTVMETADETNRQGGQGLAGGLAHAAAVPYALATPHQAPAETVQALQAMMRLGGGGQTPFYQDTAMTGRWADWFKPPIADATFPGYRTSDI